MKKLIAAALLLPFMAIAQIRYEKGYFIDNDGKRTECLVKNRSWGNNPDRFEYKLSEGDSEKTGLLQDISEFGVDGKSVYVKATVPMERTTNQVNRYQHKVDYELKPETHFFKRLFEASHSLYSYEENGLLKFFDRDPSGKFTQLIYIEYLGKSGEVRRYNHFYTQLLEIFACPGETLQSLSKLPYKEVEMINYYRKTADCKNEKSETAEIKKTKFHIRPFVGYKSMKITAGGSSTSRPEIETSKGDLAYGLEAELILPMRGYKWSVFLDVDHQKIKEYFDLPDGSSITDRAAQLDFSQIQLALGMRHYFYITNDTKIFVNGAFCANLLKDAVTVDYLHNSFTGDLYAEKFSYNFALGAGVSFKKINAELRYYTPQTLFKVEDGKFNKFMITVNYAIF